MAKKQIGNRHLIIRADGSMHAKIGRVMAATGADKSTVIRTAINWMSEEQIAAIVAQRGQHGQVQHAP